MTGTAVLSVILGIVTSCHDGDTCTVGRQPIRLEAVAAPELKEPGGPEARDALRRLAQGQWVTCVPAGYQSWGRVVAICRLLDGTDLGRAMIELRVARSCPAFGTQYEGIDHQAVARAPYCERRR